MGISYYVLGIKPSDEKFAAMKAVWDACIKAKINIPKDVLEFFGDSEPNEKGVTTYLDNQGPYVTIDGEDDYRLTVDLRKLPDDIKILQFVVSW